MCSMISILIMLLFSRLGYCQGMNYVVATLMIGQLPTAYTGKNDYRFKCIIS